MFYEKMKEEKARIEQRLQEIENALAKLPEGSFFCSKNGNSEKWYRSIHGHQEYIPKDEEAFAQQMALKKVLLCEREDLMRQLRPICAYLDHYEHVDCSKTEALLKDPRYASLLRHHFEPTSRQLVQWMQEPYEQCPYYPEQRKHRVCEHLYVRSKSESIIATQLILHHIPFRYEAALWFSNHVIYPDFTLRHPRTGETFYWEHFGMVDQTDYYQKVIAKEQRYISQGILPHQHLLETFETREHPFDTHQAAELIRRYFE